MKWQNVPENFKDYSFLKPGWVFLEKFISMLKYEKKLKKLEKVCGKISEKIWKILWKFL